MPEGENQEVGSGNGGAGSRRGFRLQLVPYFVPPPNLPGSDHLLEKWAKPAVYAHLSAVSWEHTLRLTL